METITIKSRIEVREGKELDRIPMGEMEYFVTKDGHYDGWGGSVSESLQATAN